MTATTPDFLTEREPGTAPPDTVPSSDAAPATEAVPVTPEVLAKTTVALKALAADPTCREAFLSAPSLSQILAAPASRYVVARDRATLTGRLRLLAGKGYRLGVEYVGEEATDPAEVDAVCAEYLALVDEAPEPDRHTTAVQLGFDLSNVGLLLSRRTAVDNATRILRAAARKGIGVMISMERSAFVDQILDVFGELAPDHPNVGLTVQAHLHRTEHDLAAVAAHGRKVRLVKGVYREPAEVALPRGPQLNRRYVHLAARLLDAGVPLACGTHDAGLLAMLDRQDLTGRIAELEMLHGSQPGLLRRYLARGVPCRVAAVYGENWWLHFLHRLAEHPPNVLTALADLADPAGIRFGSEY